MSAKISFDRHGGNIYQAIRQSGCEFADFLDFSANINPLGVSRKVLQNLSDAIPAIMHYPDADAFEFKQAVHEFYHVSTECVTPGNGAVELIYILCYLLRPKAVLVTAPAFSEYERAACAAGAGVQRVYLKPERDFKLNIEEIISLLPGMDMIFIGNPNNPTGTLTLNRDLELLIKAAYHRHVWVIVDEAFMDFLTDDSLYTCRGFLDIYPNLIISQSLTKFYAIPGLRLGFALTNHELARRLHAAKDQWNVNTLAQIAGATALRDVTYQQESRLYMKKLKYEMYQTLVSLPGMYPYKPAANYILVDIHDSGFSSDQMERELFKRNILIRNCANYPGLSTDYIRTAVKLPQQNQQLIAAIAEIVGDKN